MVYACAHELANLAGTGVHAHMQMLKDSKMSKRPNTGDGDEGGSLPKQPRTGGNGEPKDRSDVRNKQSLN